MTITIEGIEFEEVTREEYFNDDNQVYLCINKGMGERYFLEKKQPKKTFDDFIKELKETVFRNYGDLETINIIAEKYRKDLEAKA